MQFSQNPFRVVFYEKTGCAGNEKQKQLLRLNGISFETKSILDTTWDKKSLESFFNELEIDQIINKFAPQIKNNEINLSTISREELIELMCETPILIKRPLLEVGDAKIVGFDIEQINSLLGTEICDSAKISTCQSSDPCTQD